MKRTRSASEVPCEEGSQDGSTSTACRTTNPTGEPEPTPRPSQPPNASSGAVIPDSKVGRKEIYKSWAPAYEELMARHDVDRNVERHLFELLGIEQQRQEEKEILQEHSKGGNLGGKSGLVAVDFGCGTGRMVAILAGVASHIIALDKSEHMLRQCKRAMEREGTGFRCCVGSGGGKDVPPAGIVPSSTNGSCRIDYGVLDFESLPEIIGVDGGSKPMQAVASSGSGGPAGHTKKSAKAQAREARDKAVRQHTLEVLQGAVGRVDVVTCAWALSYVSQDNWGAREKWVPLLHPALNSMRRLLVKQRPPATTAGCISHGNSTSNGEGAVGCGRILVVETLGTNTTTPNRNNTLYTYLEEEEGFKRHAEFRTDYRFASAQEAERFTKFFFGEGLRKTVAAERLTMIPECTGMWVFSNE